MKILLPTDLSEHSKNAVRYAMQLFQAPEHQFVLMNAYHLPHAGAVMMTSVEDLMRKASVEDMQRYEQELFREFPEAKTKTDSRVLHDEAYVAIQRCAEEESIDMIVMGTTGASGMKNVLMGSVTASLVRNAGLPMLAIPAASVYDPIKRIALASDGKAVDKHVLGPLSELAQLNNAEVLLFTVGNDGAIEEDSRTLSEKLGGVPCSTHQVIGTDIDKGVAQFVEEHDCDLLTTVHHKYGWVQDLFHVSVSKRMALHTKVPLLVLRGGSLP